MTSALTITIHPFHALKRLFEAVFEPKPVLSLNHHELSDHLLRDLGLYDGDRSDGRRS